MDFNSVIGQQEVKRHLIEIADTDKVPHAIMFCGPKGSGKLPLALAFASYLLCEHPEGGNPCGTCAACAMLKQWAHPDLHFSFPIYKKKSTDNAISDDFLPEWRELLLNNIYFDLEAWLTAIKAENQQVTHYVHESDSLQRKLSLKASQGGRRIIVIWLPERMKTEMANKLLKLIEEPPTRTNFLLVSQDPDMVLGTIQSRVQRIHIQGLPETDIAEALHTLHALPHEQAQLIAHVAQGNYTEALKRINAGNEEQIFFNHFVQLMRLSYMRNIREMKKWSDDAAELGRERQKRLLAYCQRLIRENFIYNFHKPEMTFQTAEEAAFSAKFSPFINERNVIGIMEELSNAERDIEQNVNPRMVFFDFALKMILYIKQ